MSTAVRILLVEDEDSQRRLIRGILQREGFAVRDTASVGAALEALRTEVPDLILSDWRMPDRDGGELLDHVRDNDFGCGFIVMTAYGSIAHAVEAIHRGADDYLTKPFERDALLLAIRRVLRTRELELENRRLKREVSDRERYRELIGRSPAMQRLYRTLEKVAATDATVLITGESGTGKELVARSLHRSSARREAPFIAVSCGAIPESLIESELFGHEKGAFTGAHGRRTGRFEEASGGTLFLDEVAALPLVLQPKLLRVLQERVLTRVGGTGELEVDVRVIAAANQDLGEMVGRGTFREDLFYRLNVVPVRVPPLRERREDIPLLVEALLNRVRRRHGLDVASVPPTVLRTFMTYPWPGNVRELGNAVERLALLAEDGRMQVDDLPEEVRSPRGGSTAPVRLPPSGIDWDGMEAGLLRQALEMAGGNRTAAARLLGLGYKAFLYRLEKHGLA